MTEKLKAQSFEYLYATSSDEFVVDLTEDNFFNYYLVGAIGDFNTNIYNGLIIKLNSQGDTIKTKVLTAVNELLVLKRIYFHNDTTLLVLGYVRDINSNDIQLYYGRLDINLNVLEEKFIGSNLYSEYINNYKIFADGNVHIIGNALINNGSDSQICRTIITLYGDSISSTQYGSSLMPEKGWDILEFPNSSNSYMLSFGWQSVNPFIHNEILRVNSNNVIDSIVEIPNFAEISGVIYQDSAIVTSGRNPQGNSNDRDLMIKKFDSNLFITDSIILGKIDTMDTWCQSGLSMIDDKILIGGISNWQNTLFSSEVGIFTLYCLNSNLNLQWEKSFTYNNSYLNLWKNYATSNKEIILAGTTYDSNFANGNERDIYVLKLDSSGNFTTSISNITNNSRIDIYPNPFINYIIIKNCEKLKIHEITIFNNLGIPVYFQTEFMNCKLDLNYLPSGCYTYHIRFKDESSTTGSLIKTK